MSVKGWSLIGLFWEFERGCWFAKGSTRFTTIEDKIWFENALKAQAQEELDDDFQYYTEGETFWVDFLREPPDATGDEPDDFDFSAPKIYEEIPSWEFLKEKLFS